MKQTSYKDPGWENRALDTQHDELLSSETFKFHNDFTEQTPKLNKVPEKDLDFGLTLKSHDTIDSRSN